MTKSFVAVGAKLHMGGLQECCETTIIRLDPKHTMFIKEFRGDKEVEPLEYLRQSLRKVDTMKISHIYIKGLDQPGYFIKVYPKTKPKEEHQRYLIEKDIPSIFASCGLTRDKIEPLSQEQQEMVDKWLYKRTWKRHF